MNTGLDAPALVSSEALACKINQSLPMHVSAALLDRNPKLTAVLEDLLTRLSPSGLSSGSANALKSGGAAVRQARQAFLELKFLFDSTRAVLQSDALPKCLATVKDALARSELATSLTLCPPRGAGDSPDKSDLSTGSDILKYNANVTSSIDRFLGTPGAKSNSFSYKTGYSLHAKPATRLPNSFLSDMSSFASEPSSEEEKTPLAFALRHAPPGMQDPLSPEQTHPRALFPDVGLQDGVRKVLMEHLSERILDTWQNVGQFVSVQEDIPGYIQSLRDQTKLLETTLHQTGVVSSALLVRVDASLIQYGVRLVGLIEGRRLSDSVIHQVSYLFTKLHAQHCKLQCMRLHILALTYTETTVPALKSLSRRMAEQHKTLSLQVARLRNELQPYESADPSYVSLLDEYNKLIVDRKFLMSNKS